MLERLETVSRVDEVERATRQRMLMRNRSPSRQQPAFFYLSLVAISLGIGSPAPGEKN